MGDSIFGPSDGHPASSPHIDTRYQDQDLSDALPPMASPPITHRDDDSSASHHQQLSKDNCDRRRPEEEDISRLVKKMPSDLVGQHVSPFLKQHIPGIYAPVGKQFQDDSSEAKDFGPQTKDPNTKYCYRHRPDSKCRRAADETKMGVIQRVSARSSSSPIIC